jgi:hypothetical protein
MTVTFYNVTITIEAASAPQAYNELCELLDKYDQSRGGGAIEWETDTYSVDDDAPRDTGELWPK